MTAPLSCKAQRSLSILLKRECGQRTQLYSQLVLFLYFRGMKKTWFLSLFLFSLSFAFAQKKQSPVQVIEATLQRWVSGAPGGKHGTKFTVKVYINTEKKVEFQNLWLGQVNVPFDVEFFSLEIPKKIQYGDTLLLTYNQVDGEQTDKDAKRLPVNCKGAALIEATVDGKAKYFIVKNIIALAALKGQ